MPSKLYAAALHSMGFSELRNTQDSEQQHYVLDERSGTVWKLRDGEWQEEPFEPPTWLPWDFSIEEKEG